MARSISRHLFLETLVLADIRFGWCPWMFCAVRFNELAERKFFSSAGSCERIRGFGAFGLLVVARFLATVLAVVEVK